MPTTLRARLAGWIVISALAALAVLVPGPGARSEVPRLDSFGSWAVFRDGTGADRLCWVAAEATLSSMALDEDGALRGGSRILILFSAGRNELSLELRGAPEPTGTSYLTIGGERVGLFFQDGWGWLSDTTADRRLKTLMERHRSGFVNLGGAGYAFSLDGFVPALAAAEAACR